MHCWFKGADVNAKNVNARTPLHDAASAGHTDVAELLVSNGADVNAQGKRGRTPLHGAVRNRHEDVIELLVFKGADVEIQGEDGNTPLCEAIGPAVCVLPLGGLRIVPNTYSSALSVKKTR